MKWQQAHILRPIDYYGKSLPAGTSVWVCGRSRKRWVTPINDLDNADNQLVFDTNILKPEELDWPNPRMAARAEDLELLPEFADSVPMISWQEFLAGGKR